MAHILKDRVLSACRNGVVGHSSDAVRQHLAYYRHCGMVGFPCGCRCRSADDAHAEIQDSSEADRRAQRCFQRKPYRRKSCKSVQR